MSGIHECPFSDSLSLDQYFCHDHAAGFIKGVAARVYRIYPSLLFSRIRIVPARQTESFHDFPRIFIRLQTSGAEPYGMDQDMSILDFALDRTVFIQPTNWKNDDTSQKNIPHPNDPSSGHPCDLHILHPGYFNIIEFDACSFGSAVCAIFSFLQKRFYPQFDLDCIDYSCIAALKFKLQETHWRKGHKFVENVMQ